MKIVSNFMLCFMAFQSGGGLASGFITKYNKKTHTPMLSMNSEFMPFDVPIAVAATTPTTESPPLLAPVPPPHLLPKLPICHEMHNNLGEKIVLKISSTLPQFDTVGHKILSANHNFIEYILHDTYFSHDTKKMIILASIKLAQMGDDLGSSILQQYYNVVDFCLYHRSSYLFRLKF